MGKRRLAPSTAQIAEMARRIVQPCAPEQIIRALKGVLPYHIQTI
jgi:hypothetical protein